MIASETDIIVYAHWKGMNQPIKIGGMTSFKNQNKPTYHFTYNPDWLGTPSQKLLDPTLQWSDNSDNPNVGLFLDSTPDAWGRTLMQKRVSWLEDKNPDHELSSCDYLLEVSDITRTGGLRFKRDENGPFLDQPDKNSIPSLNEIPRLRRGAKIIESWENTEKTRRWLHELLPHSAAIGGARPKTIAQDEDGELWIAKFPSKYDEIDRGLWEYMTWQLAREAGIKMADSRLSPGEDGQHTFLTKRFDRSAGERIHFLSAMTATHHYLEEFGDQLPSYLELADFLRQRGSKPVMDLRQLWRRIVFNIAISNCDDHLRTTEETVEEPNAVEPDHPINE